MAVFLYFDFRMIYFFKTTYQTLKKRYTDKERKGVYIMELDDAIKMLKDISKGKMNRMLVPFMYDWRDFITEYVENEIKGDKSLYDIPEETEIEEITLNCRQADLIDEYVPLVLISIDGNDKEQASITPTEYLMDLDGGIVVLSDFEKKLGALGLSVYYDTYTPVDVYHSELDTGDCYEHTNDVKSHTKNVELDYDLYKLPFYRDIFYSEKLENTVREYNAIKDAEKSDIDIERE